jgi:hypothetical protein
MQSACAWASIYSEADDCAAALLSVASPKHLRDAMPSSFHLPRAPRSHFVLLCSSARFGALT